MRLAHLADVHLGFRQYHRQTPEGINQREADVARVFQRTIADVISHNPDLVVIAGDLFQTVRPSNPAILHAFNQFRKLREALPEAPLVIVAGNHDTPRSVETGSILKLFEAIGGVRVVVHEPERIEFEQLGVSILCVPYASVISRAMPVLEPRSGDCMNVLALHGELAGLTEREGTPEHMATVLEPEQLNQDRWNYIALGHYHVAHQVFPNAWYSGALDYVTTNPWGELQDERLFGSRGKGWLLVECGDGITVEFKKVETERMVFDLEPIQGTGLTAAELDRLIEERVSGMPRSIDDQIVRQLMYNVSRITARDLNHRCIRELKARALHYHLDIRPPERKRVTGVGSPGRRQTLKELVDEYLAHRPLDAGIDRKALRALAARYMGDASEGGEL